jgi:hypothetical protein
VSCELLEIEVEGADACLGLRHAGAGDEAKEAHGRGLRFASAGGLVGVLWWVAPPIALELDLKWWAGEGGKRGRRGGKEGRRVWQLAGRLSLARLATEQ